MLYKFMIRFFLTSANKGQRVTSDLIKNRSDDGTEKKTNSRTCFQHAYSLLSVLLVVSGDDRKRGSGVDAGPDPAQELPNEGEHDETSLVLHEVQEAQSYDRDDLSTG